MYLKALYSVVGTNQQCMNCGNLTGLHNTIYDLFRILSKYFLAISVECQDICMEFSDFPDNLSRSN